MEIIHDTLLFKTTIFESASDFTNYGVHIKDGKLELAYVQRMYKKSTTSKTWLCDELYSSQTMHKIPASVIIPAEVFSSAKWWLTGMISRNL